MPSRIFLHIVKKLPDHYNNLKFSLSVKIVLFLGNGSHPINTSDTIDNNKI